MYDKLLEIIKKYTAVCQENITLKSDLYNDLAISSIKFYLMILDIESTFDVDFKNVTISNPEFKTVGSLVKSIDRLR